MSLSSYSLLDSPTSLPFDKGFSTFFWHLYKNHMYTDVKFHLETADGLKEYHAHKLVLSLMSPVFAERFYNKGKATNQQELVLVKNLDADAFEEMLWFIYGHIPQIESPKQACNLYQVAAKFEVTSLKKQCHQFLHQIEVVPSNVFTILEVAEFMQNTSLTDRCFAVIQGKTCEVMNAYALSDITDAMIHIILDLPELSLTSEYELLKWVFSWAKEKASQEDSHHSNVREVLQEFLPNMHFLLLSNVEFTEICRDYNGFFTCDEIASIIMNISIPGSKQMPDWFNKDCILRVYPKQNENTKSNSEQRTVKKSEENENEETESKQNEIEDTKSEETKDVKDKVEEVEGNKSAAEESPSTPVLPPLKKHDLTYEELKKYDGKGEDGRICVAVNGKVFDVTRRKKLYGPDGPYPALAGRDASRCFATFSLDVVKDEYEDLSDLSSNQMESLKEWETQFQEKYPYVGRLLKPGEEPADLLK